MARLRSMTARCGWSAISLSELLCFCAGSLLLSPVRLVNSACTFDAKNLQEWFKRCAFCRLLSFHQVLGNADLVHVLWMRYPVTGLYVTIQASVQCLSACYVAAWRPALL